MKINRDSFNCWYDAITISLLSGIFAVLLSSGSDDRSAGSAAYQLLSISLMGGRIVHSFVIRNYHFQLFCVIGRVFLALALMALMSTFWSVDANVTIRRGVSLLLGLLYVIAFVSEYTFKDTLHIFERVFYITLLSIAISLVMGVGLHVGDEHAGSLKGLTGHKNNLARYLGAFLVLFLYCWIWHKTPRMLLLAFFSMVLLILTTSKTALASAIFSVLSVYIMRLVYFGQFPINSRLVLGLKSRLILVFSLLILFGFLAFYVFPLVVEALGRDLTFSGRNKIWSYALEISKDYFWLGAGYRAFWTDSITWDFFLFNPYWGGGKVTANGHNGYLDIYLELGFAGLVVLIWILIRYLTKLFQVGSLKVGGATLHAYVSWGVFFYFIPYNFFETVVLSNRFDFLWALFFMCYLYMCRSTCKGV